MGRPAKIELPLDLSKEERECRLRSARHAREYQKNKTRILARNRARAIKDPEKASQQQARYFQDHKESRIARMSEYAHDNPRVVLKARLKCGYNLSLEDFERMLQSQNNVCAICKMPNSNGKRLSVDHDHSTGQIRGLLCAQCNFAIGHMKDDPNRLRAAAVYLESHIPDVTVRDLMDGGTFGGCLTPEQEAEAFAEYEASRRANPVPCPR